MKRVPVLVVVVCALWATACAASSATINQPADGALAPAPTATFDPMATVPPTPGLVDVEPTAVEPTAVEPAPTAIESEPTAVEADPTAVVAEPTAVEAEPDVPAGEAFATVAAQARTVLDDTAIVEIAVDRTMRVPDEFDLSLRAAVIVDKVTPLHAVEVTYAGSDWDADRAGAPDTAPWQLTNEEPGDNGWTDRFGKSVTQDPTRLLTDFNGLLQFNVETKRIGDDTFRLDVPNGELLDLVPGASLSPWTSTQAVADAVGSADLVGTTPAMLTFRDGRLTRVELDYGSMLRDARGAGADLAFSSAVFRESYRITYEGIASPVPTTVPDDTPSEDETVTPLQGVEAGECFLGEQYLQADPVPVPCTQNHTAEVIYAGQFDDNRVQFPGREALVSQGQPVCDQAFLEITGADRRNSLLPINVVVESADGWEAGQRRLVCVVIFDEAVEKSLGEIDVQRIGDQLADAAIEIGDCFTGGEAFDDSARRVDCTQTHRYQAYASTDALGTEEYPGPAVISDQALEFCRVEIDAVLLPNQIDREWLIDILSPTEEGWMTFGDRLIVCILSIDEDLTASVITTE